MISTEALLTTSAIVLFITLALVVILIFVLIKKTEDVNKELENISYSDTLLTPTNHTPQNQSDKKTKHFWDNIFKSKKKTEVLLTSNEDNKAVPSIILEKMASDE